MNPRQLLAELQARGIRLTVAGDRAPIDAPRGALTPALRTALVAKKADIVARLVDSVDADKTTPSDSASEGFVDGSGQFDPQYSIWFTADATERDKAVSRAVAALKQCPTLTPCRVWVGGRDDVPRGWSVHGWLRYCELRAARCDARHHREAAEWRERALQLRAGRAGTEFDRRAGKVDNADGTRYVHR